MLVCFLVSCFNATVQWPKDKKQCFQTAYIDYLPHSKPFSSGQQLSQCGEQNKQKRGLCLLCSCLYVWAIFVGQRVKTAHEFGVSESMAGELKCLCIFEFHLACINDQSCAPRILSGPTGTLSSLTIGSSSSRQSLWSASWRWICIWT